MALRKLVAGNWKMNGLAPMLDEIAPTAAAAAAHPELDVAIFPPFTLLERAAARADGLIVGGQDCDAAAKGARTGCVSVDMLGDAGATMVIVGHSERRTLFGESDALVRAKAEAAVAGGLVPIVCVGESEAVREEGRAALHVAGQLDGSVPSTATARSLIVAYEPIWAVGTGRPATCDEVAEMHGLIRAKLIDLLGDEGIGVRILYGGSVTGANAEGLMRVPEVDGALVGGASLAADQFVPIVVAAAQAVSAAS